MRLSREQRFLLFNGGRPRLAYPLKEGKPCPVTKGHVYRLSSGLEIEVLAVKRRKVKGEQAYEWVLDYLIRDMRVTLLRSVPPIHIHKTGEDGIVHPPTKADIEAARLQSSYTHSSHGAVPSAGDAIPDVDHNLLSMRAKAKWAEREQTERPEEVARRVARTVAAQVKEIAILQARNGVDPQPFLANIQRQISEQRDKAA